MPETTPGINFGTGTGFSDCLFGFSWKAVMGMLSGGSSLYGSIRQSNTLIILNSELCYLILLALLHKIGATSRLLKLKCHNLQDFLLKLSLEAKNSIPKLHSQVWSECQVLACQSQLYMSCLLCPLLLLFQ